MMLGLPIATVHKLGPTGPGQFALRLDGTYGGTIGSDASIDNMPPGANGWTIDFWARFPSAQLNPASYPRLLSKRPAWYCPVNASGNNPGAALEYSGGAISAYVGSLDTDWHHFAMCYNEFGTRRIRHFRDGTYITQSSASSGSYNDDAATICYLGHANDSTYLVVDLAYIRFSNTVRWTTTFTPPSRFLKPAADINTIEQWNFQDGTGSTVSAEVNSANNITLQTAGTWIPLT